MPLLPKYFNFPEDKTSDEYFDMLSALGDWENYAQNNLPQTSQPLQEPREFTTQEAHHLVERAGYSLLMHIGAFWASLMHNCKLIINTSTPTACVGIDTVDSVVVLIINPNFFGNMGDTDRVGILYHELEHIALGHLIKHPHITDTNLLKKLNYANDLAINSPLIKVCKKHMTLPEETGGAPNTGDAVGNPSQQADILERTLKRAAAQTTHGDIPMCVNETFNKLAQYKAKKWHAALRYFYRSSIEGVDRSSTWSRINRRYGTQSPGTRVGEGKKLIIGVDTSGSMSVEDIQKVLGECFAMLKCGVEAKVMFFDTEVHDTKKLTKNMAVTQCGRGGTSFKQFFNKAAKYRPDGIVLFSDMDAPDDISLKDMSKMQVLWVYTNGDRQGGLWNSYGHKILMD